MAAYSQIEVSTTDSYFESSATSSESKDCLADKSPLGAASPSGRVSLPLKGLWPTLAALAHLHKINLLGVYSSTQNERSHQLGIGFLQSALLLPFLRAHSLCPPVSPSMVMKSHALSPPHPNRCL